MFDLFSYLLKTTCEKVMGSVFSAAEKILNTVINTITTIVDTDEQLNKIENALDKAKETVEDLERNYLCFVHEYDVSGHSNYVRNTERKDEMPAKNKTAAKRTAAAKKAWATRRAKSRATKRSKAAKKAWATRRGASAV